MLDGHTSVFALCASTKHFEPFPNRLVTFKACRGLPLARLMGPAPRPSFDLYLCIGAPFISALHYLLASHPLLLATAAAAENKSVPSLDCLDLFDPLVHTSCSC